MALLGKVVVLLLGAGGLAATGVFAASFTWNGSASADWFNTNNWAPPGSGPDDTVNFSSGTINLASAGHLRRAI